jgi:hypothetical protein
MNGLNWVDWLSVILAGAALFVSGLFSWKQIGLQKRILMIEQEREKDRKLELRSDLRLVLGSNDEGKDRLRLLNQGGSPARSIQISFEGKPVKECGSIFSEAFGKIKELHPADSVECPILLSCDFSPPFETELEWDDEQGHYKKPQVLG